MMLSPWLRMRCDCYCSRRLNEEMSGCVDMNLDVSELGIHWNVNGDDDADHSCVQSVLPQQLA